MTRANKYYKIIITILLMSSITLSILSTFINLVVLNKDMYLRLFDESNTYTKVEEKLYEKMNSLLGSNIDDNIKKSIITNEDVKKECNIVLSCIIEDLKAGINNKPVIDSDIYKARVKDVFKSFIGQGTSSNKELSFNDKFKIQNMNFMKNETEHNYTLVYNNKINSNEKSFQLENLASRAELEAKGRAMLKEKGLTESQARQKMAEKGITEEQIWNMLKENGYLDEEGSIDSNNKSNTSEKTQSNDDENQNSSSDDEKNLIKEQLDKNKNLYSGEFKATIDSVVSDKTKTFEEKINAISDKVSEKAEKLIDDEIQKLTLSTLIDSNLFKVSSKLISFLHKFNFVFVLISFVFTGILLKLNNKNGKLTLKNIGQVLMGIGLIFIFMLSAVYLFIKNKGINIGPEYLMEPVMYVINKFLTIFSNITLITVIIGIVVFVFTRKSKKSKGCLT